MAPKRLYGTYRSAYLRHSPPPATTLETLKSTLCCRKRLITVLKMHLAITAYILARLRSKVCLDAAKKEPPKYGSIERPRGCLLAPSQEHTSVFSLIQHTLRTE
jgi:hypothetical protein